MVDEYVSNFLDMVDELDFDTQEELNDFYIKLSASLLQRVKTCKKSPVPVESEA